MKNIFLALACILSSLFIAGCAYENASQPTTTTAIAPMTQSGFNSEHYVWESFMFPTNRTSGVR